MARKTRRAAAPFGMGVATAAFMALLIAFLDLTSSTQMIGLASAALSIPYVNEPPKNNGDKRLNVTPVPLYVRLRWGDGLPHDIDLWVACYSIVNGEMSHPVAVGFSRTSEKWLDLLRDDQGQPSVLNEEIIQSNSEVSKIPPNTRCLFNAHLYHTHGGLLPVEGEMIVIQDKDGGHEVLVGDVKFTLKEPGEERTIISATWGSDGVLFADAVGKFPEVKTMYIATKKPGG